MAVVFSVIALFALLGFQRHRNVHVERVTRSVQESSGDVVIKIDVVNPCPQPVEAKICLDMYRGASDAATPWDV